MNELRGAHCCHRSVRRVGKWVRADRPITVIIYYYHYYYTILYNYIIIIAIILYYNCHR